MTESSKSPPSEDKVDLSSDDKPALIHSGADSSPYDHQCRPDDAEKHSSSNNGSCDENPSVALASEQQSQQKNDVKNQRGEEEFYDALQETEERVSTADSDAASNGRAEQEQSHNSVASPSPPDASEELINRSDEDIERSISEADPVQVESVLQESKGTTSSDHEASKNDPCASEPHSMERESSVIGTEGSSEITKEVGCNDKDRIQSPDTDSATKDPNEAEIIAGPSLTSVVKPEVEEFYHLAKNVPSNTDTSSLGHGLPCHVIQSTPIPNSDSALRLLRKFAAKTSKFFPVNYGGSKSSSILSLFFGRNSNRDECGMGYKMLIDILLSDIDDTEDDESHSNDVEEHNVVIDSILGHRGDTMSKARSAVAAFCYLFELFCLETQRISIIQMGGDTSILHELLKKSKFMDSEKVDASYLNSQASFVTSEVMAAALTCAEGLVAHGCFDGVLLAPKEEDYLNTSSDSATVVEEEIKDSICYNAIYVVCESVYNCFLETEEVELATLKFLLTAGCRAVNTSSSDTQEGGENEAMLKGTHLLQAIRVCYRLYLSTDSAANKTTAKAALRQIVIGTFRRLELKNQNKSTVKPESLQTISINTAISTEGDDPFLHEMFEQRERRVYSDDMTMKSRTSSAGNFPSFEHKDAYLVLRSLCKLSMKALSINQDAPSYLSSMTVDHQHENPGFVGETSSKHSSRKHHRQSILIDPALDSKILALDLILEVLQKTKPEIFVNAGPHLVYAVRNYLCHSLLKNCTMDNTHVVSLSLQLFSPLVRHFRAHLKTEIEAFVTNVFFVILDSRNSTVEHKLRVVLLFEEICSDPATLAEIFLNYDCDLSAVDLFQRIVNTLAKVAKIGLQDQGIESSGLFVGGAGATRAEKNRQDHRALRLEAMKAVRKVLASLYASISSFPISKPEAYDDDDADSINQSEQAYQAILNADNPAIMESNERKSLVQIYDSKKKRKEDFAKVILKFNQKPKAGINLGAELGLFDEDDPAEVAQFLLTNKDSLDKTQIGELLGMDVEYKDGFMLKVLHHYASLIDFTGLVFDDAIKLYLSGFRLPGEAQKIDRIMEIFAERYTTQNPEVFPTADAAFILAFSVIMLNTDLHNPAIKEERRMTKESFLRNNRGISDGQDLPEEFLSDIFDRIKENPISLKEDDEAREKVGTSKNNLGRQTASALFINNYEEMDKKRMTEYKKERDSILRNTESLLRRKATRTNSGSYKGNKNFVRTEESGLKDEYVIPMFEVAWGPALAVFSTVIESANGTMGSLLSIATDSEIESAAENAAESTEVCLEGFTLAIRIAGICGNSTARSAYVHALSNFSLLGTGRLLEHRHIRCVQTLLNLGRDDGEILGPSWEYIFKAMSEVARLNQVYEEGAKFVRAGKTAGSQKENATAGSRSDFQSAVGQSSGGNDTSPADSSSFDEVDEILINGIYDGHFGFDEALDKVVIDEVNARTMHDNLQEGLLDEVFSRSSSLSTAAIKEFILQLCRVSRMEISGYGGSIGSKANDVDLTAVHYRRNHSLVGTNGRFDGKRNQPDIFCLQKLIEVTHYNMDTRPRLVFADIWNTVSGHLTSTALHSNGAVAIYAVDSFRQLSMQFLKRQELGVFEFQRKFIKPFENVMSNCKNSTVKDFLLKSVEQIITIYGDDSSGGEAFEGNHGLLKSGWRPLLVVIGQASCDDDNAIAKLGYSMLISQLRVSLHINEENTVDVDEKSPIFKAALPMRADKFVDLVEALLMYVSGPRDDMSSNSIDQLVIMCKYLADDKIPLPQNARATHIHPSRPEVQAGMFQKMSERSGSNEELELWWPILLGLSKSVGDKRPNIRIKGLITLLAIINEHFFLDVSNRLSSSSVLGDLQTLRLIFRGILTPCLEHTDLSSDATTYGLSLPDGFIRFVTRGTLELNATKNDQIKNMEYPNMSRGNDWLDTTFDHLMDGAVALVLRSIDVFADDILVEEILAMFNTCLVSDSVTLAIRGLKRLYHFIANDLTLEKITNKTWATFCHMLRRCLSVNGLPFIIDYEISFQTDNEIIVDFLQEEKVLPQRRYMGANAVSVIGSLLTDQQIAKCMGVQWYLFLFSGLGMGIRTWDKAATIMDAHPEQIVHSNQCAQSPHYAETSLYGRKWMVRLLLKHISGDDVTMGSFSGSDKATMTLLKNEIQYIVNTYLEKEASASSGTQNPGQLIELEHLTKLVCNLLEGIAKLSSAQLSSISTITPTLTACIQTDDRSIRTAVHKLLQRIFQLNDDLQS